MNFDIGDKAKEVRDQVAAFMEAHVYPNEEEMFAQIDEGDRWQPIALLEELKAKARAEGLWNLFLPESAYGAGLSNLDYAPACEEMGRSHFAPEVFNCSAPDTGNMEVLVRYGTEAQRAEWLDAAARRRDPLRLRHDRGRGRVLRRHQYRDPDRTRWRGLRHQRPQVVDLGRARPPLPHPDRHGQDRSRRTRTATSSSR